MPYIENRKVLMPMVPSGERFFRRFHRQNHTPKTVAKVIENRGMLRFLYKKQCATPGR